MESAKSDFSKFKVLEVYRNGPRFYVARLKDEHGRELVLKKLLQLDNEWTKTGFRKELAFLHWVESLALPGLSDVFPRLLAFENNKETVWYATERLKGEFQNREPSQFLLKDGFDTAVDPLILADFLHNLHAVTPEVPEPITAQFKASTLSEYAGFLEWVEVPEELVSGERHEKIEGFLDHFSGLYDAQTKVLTHFEFYGAHINVAADGGLKIIDWENIGLSDRTHDFTAIYLRAFHYPRWQEDFLSNFRAGLPDAYPFDNIWPVELVLQSLGNLRRFSETTVKEELAVKEEAVEFFLAVLDRFLAF